MAKVQPDVAILNTQVNPFEWTIPPVSSNIGDMPSLTGHTVNLINNYMIVAFGKYGYFCFIIFNINN